MAMEMEYSTTKLHPQDIQNTEDFDDWPYHEDLFQYDKALELPPLDGFFGFNSFPLPFHWDHLSQFEFQSPGNFGAEISSPDKPMIPLPPLYDDTVVDEKPPRMILSNSTLTYGQEDDGRHESELQEVTRMIERGFSSWKENEEEKIRLRNGRRSKSAVLGLEEIQRHFHIPISEAAKEMKVGLTVLKKRCRELNIMRWPHRKLKSLKSLIKNVKDMGLTNEIMGLEEHKRLVEKLPDLDLTHRTKRLRQACFKANYKKRRFIAALH